MTRNIPTVPKMDCGVTTIDFPFDTDLRGRFTVVGQDETCIYLGYRDGSDPVIYRLHVIDVPRLSDRIRKAVYRELNNRAMIKPYENR